MSLYFIIYIVVVRVEVRVRRLGGGFGAKQSRSRIPAAAAALSAYHTRKPVTMCFTLEDNMEILGRRMPTRFDYKVYPCIVY